MRANRLVVLAIAAGCGAWIWVFSGCGAQDNAPDTGRSAPAAAPASGVSDATKLMGKTPPWESKPPNEPKTAAQRTRFGDGASTWPPLSKAPPTNPWAKNAPEKSLFPPEKKEEFAASNPILSAPAKVARQSKAPPTSFGARSRGDDDWMPNAQRRMIHSPNAPPDAAIARRASSAPVVLDAAPAAPDSAPPAPWPQAKAVSTAMDTPRTKDKRPTEVRDEGAAEVSDLPILAPPSAPAAPKPSLRPAPEANEDLRAEKGQIDRGESDLQRDPKIVTVFFGTDRLPIQASSDAGKAYGLGLTAICTALTSAVALAFYCAGRNRWVLMLTVAGTLATLVFAGMMVGARSTLRPALADFNRIYGNGRGELEVGTCRVSIPQRHQLGQVERPSVFRLEFHEDPLKHVVLKSVNQQPEDAFYVRLRNSVQNSQKKEAFVFIHGFNVTFEAAARRTAQLAYDLQFDGAPIFFSWPSQGGVLEYAVDETNVVWTVPHLKEFLLGVARGSGAKAVHLVAHSMGNRALTSALQTLSSELAGQPPLFREVVLTAPDIDADVFKRDIAPAIMKTAGRVTLYASSNDEALKISKKIHGYPRAGESDNNLVVIPGMDTVDVSTVDTSLLGHDYYGNNDSVLDDLLHLLNESRPPQERQWLQPKHLGQMLYWVFARVGTASAPRSPLR